MPTERKQKVALPADQARSPAQAPTEGLHQNEVSRLDPPVCNRRLEGERDPGGGGVGVTFDGHDDLVFGQAEFSSHPIDDPAVGLVRNKPIDIRGGETVSRQRGSNRGFAVTRVGETLIDLVLERMRGTEDENPSRADGHFLTGLGVAANALALLPDRKASE